MVGKKFKTSKGWTKSNAGYDEMRCDRVWSEDIAKGEKVLPGDDAKSS